MSDGLAHTAEQRSRWQFSVRTVLLLMLAVAILSAIYRVAPQLDVFVLGSAPTILCAQHLLRCWRQRCRPSALMTAVVPLSFGMLYVVSVGPAIVLANHYPFWEDTLERIYAPLIWLHTGTILRGPLEWYADFWQNLT